MVVTFIADIVLDITYWTTKKVYNAGHWLVWDWMLAPEHPEGPQKSEVELLIHKQNETIKLLHENVLKLNEKIDNISSVPFQKGLST